jgi:LAO/AO transport system kinase
MKAGLLEIADVFVVNKADRPGADLLRRELELSVELDRREGLALGASRWSAPVHLAVATAGQGVDEVFRTVAAHLAWCRADGASDWARRRADGRVAEWLDRVAERARADALAEGRADGTLERLRAGLVRPDELVSR